MSERKPTELTHLDEKGAARMVDVGRKSNTVREAVAQVVVRMKPETARLVAERSGAKGDALQVARIAGIMGAKRTSDLIPLCHPLSLDGVDVELIPDAPEGLVTIEARVRTTGKTGVEMEALTACSVAALALYDMCKGVEKGIVITDLLLLEKRGGRSGTYRREQTAPTGRH